MDDDRLNLERGRWYGWTMYPGYGGGPYRSPILVEEATPLKTGRGVLRLRFVNAFYAAGARDFLKDLRVLHRTTNAMAVADVDSPDRMAVVEVLTDDWVRLALRLSDEQARDLAGGDIQQFVSRRMESMWSCDYG